MLQTGEVEARFARILFNCPLQKLALRMQEKVVGARVHGMWIELSFTDALEATIDLTTMVRAPPARQLKYLFYNLVRRSRGTHRVDW